MHDVIARHERIALQCSGGRDSMASLFLMRPWWDRMTVVWLNTGAQFPEIVDLMAGVRNMVPNFVEVVTDQPANIARLGHPSDVVPEHSTAFGRELTGDTGLMVQSVWSCCGQNIWFPMQKAMLAMGVTLIIRGQRSDDGIKGPLRTGTVVDGVEYLHPVEGWSRADCDAYLAMVPDFDVPAHHRLDHSSLDCWDCTAFAEHQVDRALYMRDRHPEKFERYVKLVGAIAERAERPLKHMRRIAALGD